MVSTQLDSLSRRMESILRDLLAGQQASTVLEAGSGTGRVSMQLVDAGARVTLLDLSHVALEQSKATARQRGVHLVRGNILSLPFHDETFSLTWNGGVLEHFTPKIREKVVSEMARVTKKGGFVVSFNPNRRSLAYRLGKRLQERAGTWPYGFEDPILSLAGAFAENGVGSIRESHIGSAYAFRFLPSVPRRVVANLERVEGLLPFAGLQGYLLVSIGRKGPHSGAV